MNRKLFDDLSAIIKNCHEIKDAWYDKIIAIEDEAMRSEQGMDFGRALSRLAMIIEIANQYMLMIER